MWAAEVTLHSPGSMDCGEGDRHQGRFLEEWNSSDYRDKPHERGFIECNHSRQREHKVKCRAKPVSGDRVIPKDCFPTNLTGRLESEVISLWGGIL